MSPFVRQHREAELRRLVDDLVSPLTLPQWYDQFRAALGFGRATPEGIPHHHDTLVAVSPSHTHPVFAPSPNVRSV